ncbi:MAG TPA: methylmalonyl-CoA mutase family protein, partial [Vicinamibacterales bacterium]
IQESAYQAQQSVDAGRTIVVGVNAFAVETTKRIEVLSIDPEVERRQIDRVRALRASRDAGASASALAAVQAAARSGDNLVPPIIAAVEAKATVGEIADAMRNVFGEHREIDV